MKLQFIYKTYQGNRLRVFLILLTLNFYAIYFNFYRESRRIFPEIAYLQKTDLSFPDLESFFKSTAQNKGAAYTFDLLKIAPLPKNTDIHLLGHAIGNVLYKQKGLEGINICTNDFRNACSHTIVIGLFTEKGTEAIDEIASACRSAPGGSGAYGMCFHGLGHGVLAYANYDFMAALSLCRQVGTQKYNYMESSECVGGMVMELVSGIHDPVSWEKAKTVYFRNDDPLYPCNQGFIPSNARHHCFLYLTPHLWDAVGGNPTNMTDDKIKKSFAFCNQLTGDKKDYQMSCFGGFGKEFLSLVQSEDIRKVTETTQEQRYKIYQMCLLAENQLGIESCLREAINSFYWGGENKPDAAISFCSDMTNAQYRYACFSHLIGAFGFYNQGSPKQINTLCNKLPDSYQKQCHATFQK